MLPSLAHPTPWLIVGFTGQALFFSRFLIQWIQSEREGRSTIPRAFWYLSLVGGLFLLVYAIYRQDPVFIMGQSVGAFVYIRNLMLLKRQGRAPEVSEGP
jgi:lipid-A-disaccharide synthase-like uncharacterized protein